MIPYGGRPHRALAAAMIAILSGGLAGCAPDAAEGGGWTGTIRDSAGIAIVENPDEALWAETDRWVLAEELRIGTARGDPTLEFAQISGIAELSDGRLAVLDAQAQELRIFSAGGAHLRTVGGAGSGPGEFGPGAGPVLVGAGDRLFVPDPLNQRLNRLTPGLEPLPSVPLDFARGMPMAWADAPSGRLLSQMRPLGLPGGEAADGSDVIIERGPGGTVVDTIARFPSGATFSFREDGADLTFFSPEPVWTVTSGGIVLAVNDRYRFEVYEGGEVVRIFGKPFEPAPIPEADRQLIREAMIRIYEEFGLAGPQLDFVRNAIGFADSYPAYASIQAGPEGSIWVQRLQRPSDLPEGEREAFDPRLGFGSHRWDVFDADGRYLGVIEMPPRFQPLRFEDDRILGIQRDELDVQSVLILRIRRGDGPAAYGPGEVPRGAPPADRAL